MQNSLHLVSEYKKLTTTGTTMNSLNLQLARTLVHAGCDLNHRDYSSHETPIFRAITTNNYDLVKYMVSEGVDMSARNSFGNDVLSRSIQLGRFRIARLLIVADSPIRVYSCIYRIPHADDLTRGSLAAAATSIGADHSQSLADANDLDPNELSSENFLQYSIAKYEEFLAFLQTYTQRPRSLLDLSRLCVRNQMRKPVSLFVHKLGTLPQSIVDLVLLKDIDAKVI